MASAGSATLSTSSVTTLFDFTSDNGSCVSFVVKNPTSNTSDVYVRVDNLHSVNQYILIRPGEKEYFRVNSGSIRYVYAYADTGTPIVYYGVVEKNI